MTGQAERIREAHRGCRQAEPAARSRLIALETFGLRFERVDDFNVLVEGRYHLNLALSYWRAEDNSSHGYLVSALAAEVNKNSNPAPGRDSDTASDRTADSTTATSAVIAESAAGTSSVLQQAVWP